MLDWKDQDKVVDMLDWETWNVWMGYVKRTADSQEKIWNESRILYIVYCITINHTTLLLYMHWIKSTRTILKKRMRQKIYIILHSSKLKMIVLGWINGGIYCVYPMTSVAMEYTMIPVCDWSSVRSVCAGRVLHPGGAGRLQQHQQQQQQQQPALLTPSLFQTVHIPGTEQTNSYILSWRFNPKYQVEFITSKLFFSWNKTLFT